MILLAVCVFMTLLAVCVHDFAGTVFVTAWSVCS